ncbi:MAG: PKD domain-containing protein [Fimbriimonadaceae bacterium]|nr:PKD domain-containing protein [Fimbriimonadaceae bacterium]
MTKTRQWASFATLALAGAAMSQSIVVYNPVRSIADQHISVRPWGSGTIAQTDEAAYEGTNSIRFFTRNFFQGGSLLLGQPVDLATPYADKAQMLQIVYRTADGTMTFGSGRVPGGAPGGFPGGPPGGLPGSRGGGRGDSGGFSGGPPGGIAGARGGGGVGGLAGGQNRGGGGVAGGPAGASGAGGIGGLGGARGGSNAPARLEMIRVVVGTTDGKKSEAYVPASTSTGRNGWNVVGVPLQAIKGFERTNKVVKDITFSGDAASTVYLGELRVLSDETPISGEPNRREWNLALGDEIELYGVGFGGSSALQYSWDFDSSDGVSEDAIGQVVRRKFRKPGTFTVTLTISDVYGLKQPYSTTVKVIVNN